jgi:hypothetical protein
VQLAAVKQNGFAIQYIKNPSESTLRFWCKNYILTKVIGNETKET